MSAGPLTLICIPDTRLDDPAGLAEAKLELAKGVTDLAVDGGSVASHLCSGVDRLVITAYPLSLEIAKIFIDSVTQLMTDLTVSSSVPSLAEEKLQEWIQLTASQEKWYALPEHQPLDYTIATDPSQGTVAIIPMSFYRKYKDDPSVPPHRYIEYGRFVPPVPVNSYDFRQRVETAPSEGPSKYEGDMDWARLEVAVLEEVRTMMVERHRELGEMVRKKIEETVKETLENHVMVLEPEKIVRLPYMFPSDSALSQSANQLQETHFRIQDSVKHIDEVFTSWTYSID